MDSEKNVSFSNPPHVREEQISEQNLSTPEIDHSMQKKLSRRTILRAGTGLAVVAIAGAGIETWFALHPHATFAKDPSPTQPQPGDTLVVQWNKISLQAIADTGTGPTIGARALAIVHTCMYDAWTTYDKKAVPTQQNGIQRLKDDKSFTGTNTSISYAAYRALMDLFPSEVAVFNTFMQSLNLDPTNMSTNIQDPIGVGNVAAKAVITYRHSDGSNQLNGYADTTGYTPVNTSATINDPNRWQPLKTPSGADQKFLTPHWGTVTPFALTSGSQFRPAGLGVLTPTQYQAQVDTILQISAGLNDTSKTIAEYWSDGPHTVTPPGHWDLFAQFVSAHFVSKKLKNATSNDIMLFFALTNAIFDASIACWECKRYYDSVRPFTAVHYLYAGQQVSAWAGPNKGTQSIDGASWRSYLATPAFAEYVSGHSTFSATGAYILSQATGSDTFGNSFTASAGSSLIEPGMTPASPVTLSWPTFSGAAVQAGMSRQYGGIHFNQADVDGRALGNKVAPQAGAKALAYITGNI